jgi:hypothetical protein
MRQQAEGVYRTWLKNVREASDIAFLREALGFVSPTLDSAESLSSRVLGAAPARSQKKSANGKPKTPSARAPVSPNLANEASGAAMRRGDFRCPFQC